jgi:hypothetical protein
MGTTDVLRSSIQQTHDSLTERMEVARSMGVPAAEPRLGYQRIDTFLATTSKHLHAVDAVLLPRAKQLPEGGDVVHEYLRSAKDLEVALVHVKAHEYGSVYETTFAWPVVWDDVSAAMSAQWDWEEQIADWLTETLDDAELERMTQRLQDAELHAPSRPHPYVPHTGVLGKVSRTVMHTADQFWDHVEGRMIPEPVREPKKPPGRMAQYLMGDPRFDEEELPGA